MTLGQDADFNEERLSIHYHTDLANNLGNLLQRVVAMTDRYCGRLIPKPGEIGEEERGLRAQMVGLPARVIELANGLAINAALGQVMDALSAVNAYLHITAPWEQVKVGRMERVATILYTATEALRLASVLLQPVLPKKIAELWSRLGWRAPLDLQAGLTWGLLNPRSQVTVGEPLFPRIGRK